MAQDDANPRRRCVFGTEEAARSYVDGLLEGTNPVDPEGSHG